MKNLIGLASLMNGAIATPIPSTSPNYLNVPVNLHVFHSYYVKHYSYRYLDKYSFVDRTLILDKRSKEPVKYLSSALFDNLKATGERYFEDDDYRSDHTYQFFTNWSWTSERKNKSLKDIVQMKVDHSTKPFSPFYKKIFLNYDYEHINVIPIYALYFDGKSTDNQINSIHFGRLKASGTGLPDTDDTHFVLNAPSCRSYSSSYNRNIHGYVREEGFDGLCDNIKIDAVNRNFRWGRIREYKYSTPYVSYKITDKDNWKKQYYYSILGDLTSDISESHNLLGNHHANSWYIDYDDIFALEAEDGKLKIVLNEDSEQLKKLNLDQLENNKDLENFLRVSSYLNFEVSFNHSNKQVKKLFTIQDVIKEKAYIEPWEETDKLGSEVVLTVTPGNPTSVGFPGVQPDRQELTYKVNIDKLSKSGKVVDGVEFKLEDTSSMFPSELLNLSKLSQYFHWTHNSEKFPMDERSLDLLDLSGEVDDVAGTAVINYKFKGETKKVHLRGFQKAPRIHDVRIHANTTEEALKELKTKFPEVSDYFWNQLSFKEKYSENYSYEETTLQAFTKPFGDTEKLFMKSDWDLSGLEIVIPSNKDFHLIQKEELANSYEDLSDLFDLTPFSSEVGLSKDDYQYKILQENDDTIEVMVSLISGREKLPRFANKNKSYYKTYTFNKPSLKSEKQRDSEGLVDSLMDSENVVVAGAGAVFLGTTGVTLMKRFGFWKTKR